MFQLGNCNFNIFAVVKYTKQEIELQERVCLWVSCPFFRMSEASKLHIVNDNTLPSTGWKTRWDLIIASRFLYRKVQVLFWDLWLLGGYGYWFCVDHFKSRMTPTKSKLMCCLLCWTLDVSALCFQQSRLLGSTVCCLVLLFGWLWPFRICGTKWTNLLSNFTWSTSC